MNFIAVPKMSTEHYLLLARLDRPFWLSPEERPLAHELVRLGLAETHPKAPARLIRTERGTAVRGVIG